MSRSIPRTHLSAALVAAWTLAAGAALAEPAARVVREGTLEVQQEDDFTHGQTRVHHLLKGADGGPDLAVRFQGRGAEGLRSGARVRLRGDSVAGTLTVGVEPGALEVLAAAPAVTGARRALVMIVNFADSAVSCTDSAVSGLMFTNAQNIDGYYREISQQQLSFPADTNGDSAPDVMRVSISSSVTSATCDYNTWAANADAAATAAGANLSLYQHKVYVLPSNISACGWAGLGNVGCSSTCRAWIKTCDLPDVYAHELGHNLGMSHASYDTNNDGAVDATCPFNSLNGEYCDYSDIMGIGGLGYRWTSGPHLFQQGWYGAGKLQDVSAAGSYTLAPIEVAPGSTASPQILRIAKADSPGTYYYLTYRRAQGYDATLRSAYTDRLSVHRFGGSGNTLFISALTDGQSFNDAANSLTVTVVGHSTSALQLQVSLACATSTPTVSLSPSSLARRPGVAGSYTVSVTNRDSGACGASTFNLSGQVPAAWGSALSPTSLTLAPGAAGSATLTVTADPAATSGSYAVGALASDPALSGHSGSGGASFVVDALAPNPVSNLSGTLSNRTRVTLTWTAPADNGGAGVSSYDVYRNGALLASTSNTSYVDNSTARRTTYQYYVVAQDAAGNRAAPGNTISVTTR